MAGLRFDATRDDEIIATTWSFHYRLLRALADDRAVGALSRASAAAVRRRAAAPPPSRLVVLASRRSTALAAEVAVRHGLNLLAGELVAAAKLHRAGVMLAQGNVGRNWPSVLRAEGIELDVIDV